ncbi:MAG TPA: hypothetical protein VKZ85_04085 [Woeseiaceae bacterium]|nr:hypothetical protein [Woeseiaceae bacterium]
MRVSGMITAGLAVLALAAGSALAQEDEAEGCSVCEFDAETIVGSTTHYREFLDRMAAAEVPLREYTQDSLTSIEMGSGHAVRDFSRWYRHRIEQQNAEELQSRMIAEFLGEALTLGLNYFLPGSGAVANAIRGYGSRAYGVLVSRMPDGSNDPAPYLQRISEDLEDGTDQLQAFIIDMFHGTDDQALRDQMDMIKMEYVWEKEWQREEGHPDASRRSPGDNTRRLLREIGIGPGGRTTVAAVHERVLKKLIKDVYCAQLRGNPVMSCESDAWLADQIATGMALRLIAAEGDPARMYSIGDAAQLRRICAAEPSHWAWQNADCRR